jgi:peptidoglycan/xylan/chitin deacetylase (PgdA/CDA1 family)
MGSMSVRSALIVLASVLFVSAAEAQTRLMAVTIDDLPTVSVAGNEIGEAERVTRDLVAALVRHKVPAIGFVNERKLQPGGTIDPRRIALLQQWIDAGLELGNHTFSHPDLHKTPIADFERDLLEGEKVTRELLRKAGKPLTYFRHPFLHTGRDPETRARLDAFLLKHGYRVAPVTVDNYDYVFAAAYDRARVRDGEAGGTKVAAVYLEYMQSVVAFYEQQSQAIVGREIPQTLLLHANALNAATFDDLARMLEKRGYGFITLDDALRDPAYASRDTYYGPAGITWLHRWAMTMGKPGTIFAGEPAVPGWIEQMSK